MTKISLYSKLILAITLCLFLNTLSSCKKDRLKNEKEVLIGTWRWEYSIRTNQPGNNWQSDYTDTLTPLLEGDTYKMEFCKNGKIHFYKNDELTEKQRIVFYNWIEYDNSAIDISIRLNNDDKKWFSGALNDPNYIESIDTMVTWRYFPFKGGENCHQAYFDCTYDHYFVRE